MAPQNYRFGHIPETSEHLFIHYIEEPSSLTENSLIVARASPPSSGLLRMVALRQKELQPKFQPKSR